MPETLYNFICRDENVKTLNKIKLKFPHAIEIVKLFIEDESIGKQQQQFDTLKDYLIKMQNYINLSLETFFQDVLQELTIMVFNLRLHLIFITRIT